MKTLILPFFLFFITCVNNEKNSSKNQITCSILASGVVFSTLPKDRKVSEGEASNSIYSLLATYTLCRDYLNDKEKKEWYEP